MQRARFRQTDDKTHRQNAAYVHEDSCRGKCQYRRAAKHLRRRERQEYAQRSHTGVEPESIGSTRRLLPKLDCASVPATSISIASGSVRVTRAVNYAT